MITKLSRKFPVVKEDLVVFVIKINHVVGVSNKKDVLKEDKILLILTLIVIFILRNVQKHHALVSIIVDNVHNIQNVDGVEALLHV